MTPALHPAATRDDNESISSGPGALSSDGIAPALRSA